MEIRSIEEWSSVESVKKLMAQAPFSGVFFLNRVMKKTARNGSSFLMVEFKDRTGAFGTICFEGSALFDTLAQAQEGCIFLVSGVSDHYQDRFSPKITGLIPKTEAEIEAEGLTNHLVACSPENILHLRDELLEAVDSIKHPELKQTVQYALDDVGDWLMDCPAAISMHHAYKHGLLEHTMHLVRISRALFPIYPEVDPSLVIAGVILHDMGKTLEYQGLMKTQRTPLGVLQGHVVLGYRIARKAAFRAKLDPILLENLEHIILSHQGELEWGAAAMAATPEAVFVSMVDNLDAKMGMVQQALRETDPDQVFSEYLPGLKARVLCSRPSG